MRAWVATRREAGSLLNEPVRIGDTPAPMDLLVVEVTDQGQRHPTKVARLVPAGTRTAVAQLIAPKLVWFKNWQFVLTGIEELTDAGGKVGVAQSWLCKLAVPDGAVGLRAAHTHKNGVEVPKSMVYDRFSSRHRGALAAASTLDPALGRHTIRAEMTLDAQQRSYPALSLLDCELDWMAQERFALSGLELRAAYDARPAALLRQGWICDLGMSDAIPDDARQRHQGKSPR